MTDIKLPTHYNYIGAFLTFKCTLSCEYCITNINGRVTCESMSADDWIKGLNRIETRADLPITLQGGEPTQHPGFYKIVNEVEKPMDILTNGEFDIDAWISNVPAWKFHRFAPYASIRFSYHPRVMHIGTLVDKVWRLQNAGYQVGIWMVDHPGWQHKKQEIVNMCEASAIDLRMKEFLGVYEGKLYGTYKYKGAVLGDKLMDCWCKPSEMLIAPNGVIHRCHSDLYGGRVGTGHLLDKKVELVYRHTDCEYYGTCNPCDVKVKTNRLQEYGHTSVHINSVR